MYIFTLGSKFTHKGVANDDLLTATSIFKKVNKIWENSLDGKIYWKFGFIFMGLAKFMALFMVLLLMGSSLVGLIVYFIKLIHQNRNHPVSISFLENN